MINSVNLTSGIKVITKATEALSPDGADKIIEKFTHLEFPNGKKANNMLDAFIACTGAKIEDYAAKPIIDIIG